MKFLDTDSLTLVYYGKPGITERVIAARERGELALPISVRTEMLIGRLEALRKAGSAADLLRMQERLLTAESFLATFPVIPYDAAAAGYFDRLRVNKKLKKIGRGDLLNACIALAHGATLVTRNTKDYAHIPGLNLENWAD